MRYKRPDYKNALSIITAARKEMEFTLTIEPNDNSASTIIRNIYECFRMLGDALLILQGIESEDHLAPINELMKIQVNTGRPINLVDNLRRLRHNINYYGYLPSKIEAEDVISLAKNCFEPIYDEIEKKIK